MSVDTSHLTCVCVQWYCVFRPHPCVQWYCIFRPHPSLNTCSIACKQQSYSKLSDQANDIGWMECIHSKRECWLHSMSSFSDYFGSHFWILYSMASSVTLLSNGQKWSYYYTRVWTQDYRGFLVTCRTAQVSNAKSTCLNQSLIKLLDKQALLNSVKSDQWLV